MISALKEAGDRSINQGNLNRNYFAGLKENIKPPKRSKKIFMPIFSPESPGDVDIEFSDRIIADYSSRNISI